MRTSVAKPFWWRTPAGTGRPIEGELADPGVLEEHPLLAGLHVDGHEVAQGQVVVREEERAAGGVISEGRDAKSIARLMSASLRVFPVFVSIAPT